MDIQDNPAATVSGDPLPQLPPPRRIRIIRDGILAFLGALAVGLFFTVAILVVAMIGGGTRIAQDFKLSAPLIVSLLVAVELPFAVFAIFLRWQYKRTHRGGPPLLEGRFLPAVLVGILGGLATAAFGLVHALVSTYLFGKASTESMEEVMKMLSVHENPTVAAALFLAVAVLAPLCEEFFFRGALFLPSRNMSNAKAAAIASSVLFAIAHLNPAMFTYYLVFGLTMCWLLSKTKTIAAPIAAHMTVNTFVCIAVLVGSATK